MTGIFLQARLNSKRLPEKALLDLSGKTVVEHAMDSLRKVPADVHALLTDEESFDILKKYVTNYDFEIYAGSSEDVMKRYLDAAHFYETDTIIRATGDNPLVSWEMAIEIMKIFFKKGSDFASYLNLPLGTGVEILKTEALKRAFEETSSGYYREHMSPYIKDNPHKFDVCRPEVDETFSVPDAVVTLDTVEDYLYISKIYEDLYRSGPIALIDLITWLRNNESKRRIRNSA